MDECLPPVIRDNKYFMLPFFYLAYGGRDLHRIMNFKSVVGELSAEEYEAFYAGLDSISRNRATDLNRPCVNALLGSLKDEPATLIDIGCGNGYLLRQIADRFPQIRLTACDVIDRKETLPFDYLKSDVQCLGAADDAYDVVTCCHTLEHVPALQQAVQELIRVARNSVFIVVPCQRYFYYTLDEHINFFTDRHQILNLMGLRKEQVVKCERLAGDWMLEINCGSAQ